MRISVSSTHALATGWVDALRQALPHAQVDGWVSGAAPADYAVVWAPEQRFFDEQAQLKAIFNAGAGVDALLKLRLPPAALLVRLRDAGMGVQMAEYVCHAVIGYFREFEALRAAAEQARWQPRRPKPRADFAVGIMGMGTLGAQVAASLRQFDYPVLGWSRSPKAVDGVKSFVGPAALPDFLAQSKVLVCLLPLTAETENILSRSTLSQLPQGAYVINVARGAHVVEQDLRDLLDDGHLAGATLDVFRTEPLPLDHPFWRHPKITVTPHNSAQTLVDASVAQIAHNIQLLERGQLPEGVVNMDRGY